tara:strand:+ start:1011 stop:1295 length:285 start_codon:yes stop_codon:yes gene_type:complete
MSGTINTWTYVHFDKQNTEQQINQFIKENTDWNDVNNVNVISDIITWKYADEQGNKVKKSKSEYCDNYRVLLNRKIITNTKSLVKEYIKEDWFI